MQAYFPEYVIDYWFNDGFVIVKFRDDTVTNLYDAMLQEDGFFDFYKANDRLVIDAVAFYERVGKEFLEQMREAPDGEDE